ncbi:MAG: flagellar biosynthetic protein FliO [Planctomycetaceae bacterium]
MTSRIWNFEYGLLLIICLLPARLLADADSPQRGPLPHQIFPRTTEGGATGLTRGAPPAAPPVSTGSSARRITRSASLTRTSDGARARKISPAGSLWTTFGALLILIAIILVAARLWKRHLPSVGGLLGGEVIEMLGRKPIDQKRQLQLIRIGSRILVVGTWAEGMVTLTEITEPSEVDCIAGLCHDSGQGLPGTSPFANLFRRKTPETIPSEPLVTPLAESPSASRFQMPPRPEIDVQAS